MGFAPDVQIVADYIRARRSAGVRTAQLRREMGLDAKQISRLEDGTGGLSVATLDELRKRIPAIREAAEQAAKHDLTRVNRGQMATRESPKLVNPSIFEALRSIDATPEERAAVWELLESETPVLGGEWTPEAIAQRLLGRRGR